MQLSVRDISFFVTECQTRLPFRFGMVTMTRAPLLLARVSVEGPKGRTSEGYASELAVPKWFEKDPQKSLEDDWQALGQSCLKAAEAWQAESGARSVFEHWWGAYRARVASRPEDATDRLVRGFGVALVERAVMDAACRMADLSFFDALRQDLFGFRPGAVHPSLGEWNLSETLPPKLPDSLRVRHTVGLLDTLTPGELDPATAVKDGLPETLVENIHAYGLDCFKIKVGGDHAADVARLTAIGAVLNAEAPEGFLVTLDGNEQYRDPADLAAVIDEVSDHKHGRQLVQALQYIEQPLPRSLSFEPSTAPGLAQLTKRAPILIDEADYGTEAYPLALARGYLGVSTKNCKGVFRSLLNRGLVAQDESQRFQSAEDLTNLGAIALQQDLATVLALGLPHVERNGHQYFRGLDHLPWAEVKSALKEHPDLYEQTAQGARLRIVGGNLSLSSLKCPGYAHRVDVFPEERMPLEEWLQQPD